MIRIRLPLIVISLMTAATPNYSLMAQSLAKSAPTEPERGRLGWRGIVREMRDERLNRLNPQPPTPEAKPKAPTNRQPPQPINAPSAQRSAQAASTRPPAARNTMGNQANIASKQTLDRTGSYPQKPTPIREAEYSTPVNQNPITNSRFMAPPSASAVLSNRIPYNGPGVIIRLPYELNVQVNYLVDNADQRVIRPGEEHKLNRKSTYEVRFSRGVTDDGRSFGEARYTVREGSYRFALTAEGWDLQREPDTAISSLAPNILNRKDSIALQEPKQSSQFDSPSISPIPSTNEETLPAPAPLEEALE